MSDRRPPFEIEFADLDALSAAHDRCRREGVARVPGVSLGVGRRCALLFITADGSERRRIEGRVLACHEDPIAIELEIVEEQPRKSDQAAIRNLSIAEQIKLARSGDQRQRISLERIYGKTVWEALLSNPRITPPEVARIARKGALPTPLMAAIVDNAAWATSASVRRAALTNPRLSSTLAIKLLRMTPKHELKILPKQTAYPAAVRELARKLLKG